jgi:hypothetical protein
MGASEAKREANHEIVRMIIPERAAIAAKAKTAVNGS